MLNNLLSTGVFSTYLNARVWAREKSAEVRTRFIKGQLRSNERNNTPATCGQFVSVDQTFSTKQFNQWKWLFLRDLLKHFAVSLLLHIIWRFHASCAHLNLCFTMRNRCMLLPYTKVGYSMLRKRIPEKREWPVWCYGKSNQSVKHKSDKREALLHHRVVRHLQLSSFSPSSRVAFQVSRAAADEATLEFLVLGSLFLYWDLFWSGHQIMFSCQCFHYMLVLLSS